MADDRAGKLAEEALNKLTAELEAGKSDALQTYLATMSRFHHYSPGNVFLIAAQKPTATHVAGYHTWKDLGRQVKKEEKGIMILAPIVVKRKEADQTRPSPNDMGAKKNDESRVAGFRTAFVFDVSQTEGKELPQFAKTTGDPKDFADKLKTLVEKQGIQLEYDRSIAPAYGVSSGGKIRLLPGMDPAEEFSVLVHELAHELLHQNKDQGRLPKTMRETQAEAVAYVVSRGVGLETNSAAADYIKLYNGDKKTLAESLSVIQGASSKILDELLPEQGQNRAQENHRAQTRGQSIVEREPSGQLPPPTATQTPDQSDSISFDR